MFNITPSQEYEALQELLTMDACASLGLNSLRSGAEQAYQAFWFGKVSPVIKVQLLGTKAQEVFTRSAQAQAFLATNIEGYVPLTIPPEYEINWNEDGSATILDVVIEPQSEP